MRLTYLFPYSAAVLCESEQRVEAKFCNVCVRGKDLGKKAIDMVTKSKNNQVSSLAILKS